MQEPSGGYESQMVLCALKRCTPDLILPLHAIAQLLACVTVES